MNSKQSSGTASRSRRAYDATGRQAEAAARRRRVIDAARDLFLEDGYAATSINAIAKRAGVSAPTVYAQFESKAGILARLVYTAVAGDDEEAGLARDRPDVAPAFAPGLAPADRIRALAGVARRSNERSAHLIALAESVAGTDEAVRLLTEEFRDGSRSDALAAARSFAPGELRPDLRLEEVADLLWAVAGPGTFNLLVHHVGYRVDEFEDWLARTMLAVLLP